MITVKKKRTFKPILVLIFCLLVFVGITNFAGAKDNLVLLKSGDWARGYSEGLRVTEDGCLTLISDNHSPGKEGFFISPSIESEFGFTHMVPFWNATTPAGTGIGVKAKLKIDDEWSPWLKIATWNENKPSTYDTSSPRVETKIDTLAFKSRKADEFKLLVELYSENSDNAPTVRLIGATYWNSREKNQSTKSGVTGYLKDLEVPKESQFEEPASIAPLICSPTALSMVLQYYGNQVNPVEVARGVYDNGAEIYGNWPFNTAYAARHGLEAYVRYFTSIKGIKDEIAAGRPTVVSLAYEKGELDGSPIESTAGHLVVVRGFLEKGDQEYVIVNDPAAKTDRSVRRSYRLDQFISAWNNIGYVIRPLN